MIIKMYVVFVELTVLAGPVDTDPPRNCLRKTFRCEKTSHLSEIQEAGCHVTVSSVSVLLSVLRCNSDSERKQPRVSWEEL